MRLFKLIFSILIIISLGFLLYMNQNLNPEPIKIWLYSGFVYDLPFPVVFAVVLTAGVIIGFLTALIQIIAQKREVISLKSKVRRLQVELDSLRNQSVEDEIIISDTDEGLNL
tara:strand:+ start:227 stop:565 length:339 start_codon:yes stop_codon:yes gene_type:complete